MTFEDFEQAAAKEALCIFGALNPDPEGQAPDGAQTLLLFGPQGPGFWPHFSAQPEYLDGAPDPLDRWSKRVIGRLAQDSAGRAIFPSDGPPYPPFQAWALASGRAWVSPVTLLVHDTAGLMLSYRGAIALPDRLPIPQHALFGPAGGPCQSCAEHACLSACPVGALTSAGYDVATCHEYLDTPSGESCLSRGCALRRACPVSQSYGRVEEQSAFHMKAFHH